MKKTGQLLREAREKKGLTIAEISHVTKINPKALEALEQGVTDQLPQRAFIRGFVQTYAKYLGLDVSEILRLFQEEMGQTKPDLPTADTPQIIATTEPDKEKPPTRKTDFDEDPNKKSRIWMVAGTSVVLILLIGFVVQMIKKYEKESEIPKEGLTVAKIETVENTDKPTTTLSAEGTTPTTPKSTTTLAETTTSLTTTTSSSVTTTLSPVSAGTQLSTTTSTTTSNSSTSTSTTLAAKPQKSIEVIVEALDNVTLGYRIDSGVFQTIKLAPEQVHTFKGSSTINIDVSDGGMINIIYNGQDRGVPGSLGQPIKLKYP